jgi:hypothetical protein
MAAYHAATLSTAGLFAYLGPFSGLTNFLMGYFVANVNLVMGMIVTLACLQKEEEKKNDE